jgi:hypothetical protein
MSNKSYLLGDVELSINEIKKLSQYFQEVLTYDANKKLVPKKDEKGEAMKKLTLNFSIFEEGRYGKNVSFTLPQSKEQREAKEPKKFVANGKIFFASDDLKSFVQKSENKQEAVQETVVVDDSLPF